MDTLSKQEKIDELYRLIAGIDTPEACRAFFDDLCTCKEIEKMAERVYAAKLLMDAALAAGGRDNISVVLVQDGEVAR